MTPVVLVWCEGHAEYPVEYETRTRQCQQLGHLLERWPHLPLSVCTWCGVSVPEEKGVPE